MKKWIGYLVVGSISFAMGMSIPHQKTNSEPEQSMVSAESDARVITTSAPIHAEEIPMQPQGKNLTIKDLSSRLFAMDPTLYTEIKKEMEGEAFSSMLEELIQSNPSAAADLLANSSDSDLSSKTSLYLNLAKQWSSSDPVAAHAWLQAQKSSISPVIYNGSLAYIAANYVKLDPEQSLALLELISDKSTYELTRHEIANRWVEYDHEGAFKWLESAAEQGLPNKVVTAYYLDMMGKYIKINPSDAAGLVQQLASSEIRPYLSAHVAAELSQVNLRASMDWVQALSDEASRMAGIQEIVNMQSSTHPEEVVNFLLTQPVFNKRLEGLIANAFETLAFQDDVYALDLLQRLPETAQSTVAESVTYGLLSQDEKTAMDWINAQPAGRILDGAASVMVVERMESDPIGAIEWSKKIGDQTRRNKVLRDLAINAEAKDLPAIQATIGQTNLSDTQLSLIQEVIAERLKEEFAAYALP